MKGRHLMPETRVKQVGEAAVTGEDGVTFCPPPEHLAAFTPGVAYRLEGRLGSVVTGCLVGGQWLWRKTDEALADERRVELARFALRQAEDLAAGRQAWEAREAALPGWLRVRLATFRERGGERFELDGWHYELIVAELAALYVESGMEETEEVTAYADAHGVTANQDEVARMLARARLADDGDGWTAAGTVSALSPITGEPFYVKEPK